MNKTGLWWLLYNYKCNKINWVIKNKRKLNQEDALSAEEIAQMQLEDLKQIKSEESGYKLVPKYYGYVRGILMVYILIVSGCIGLALGTLLFRIMN